MTYQNFFGLLEKNFQMNPDSVAVVDGEKEFTYNDIYILSYELSERLRYLYIRRGDRVAIHFKKDIREVVAIFAISHLEAIFVIINHQWSPGQVEHVFKTCQPKVLLTDDQRGKYLTKCSKMNLPILTVTLKESTNCKNAVYCGTDYYFCSRPMDKAAHPPSIASIIFTSGSTGKAKGVNVSHKNLIDGARIVSGYLKNVPHDRILSLLPFSFDYGLNQLTTMFYVGGTIILQKNSIASDIIATIVSKRVTGFAVVPTLLADMIDFLEQTDVHLKDLRYLTNSGGSIPQLYLKKIPELLGDVDFYLMYGFTEAFRSTYLPPSLFREKCGSIGKAVPGVDIFVIDSEGHVCPENTVGELVHAGAFISEGYWNNPQESKEKIGICKDLISNIGNVPVAYSGDLVLMDSDGICWFRGRRDQMLKVSGHRISPNEIESYALDTGMVQNVIAFGLPHELHGHTVALVIAAPSPNFSEKQFYKACMSLMPSYMVPKRILYWDGQFPKSSNEKIDRVAVLDKLNSETEQYLR